MSKKRNFRNWINAYVDYTKHTESPDAFHFWTAVSTVAGALRRRVYRNELIFQWTPNFYIILVGPPGVAAKSTTIRTGLSLLERVPGIHFGPQSMTWQALFEALSQSAEAIEINGELQTMSCMTCAVSELGTFLRADDNELVAQLISMWDGQCETFGRRTKKDGEIKIVNPWMNIIACTTPSWIKENCKPDMIDGGLFSRIMFVYGDTKRKLIAYPSQHQPEKSFYETQDKLVEDLLCIAEMSGEYDIDPDGLQWGIEWYERHNRSRPTHLKSERFGGYLARKQGHLHKLAMVFAAAQRDDLIIKKDDLQLAEHYLSTVERDMLRVFEPIGQSTSTRTASELLHLVKHYQHIDMRQLWQECYSIMSYDEFNYSVKALVETGWVKMTQQNNVRYLTYTKEKSND